MVMTIDDPARKILLTEVAERKYQQLDDEEPNLDTFELLFILSVMASKLDGIVLFRDSDGYLEQIENETQSRGRD